MVLFSLSSCTKAQLINPTLARKALSHVAELTLSSPSSAVVVGSTLSFSAQGGVSPYQFEVLSGAGTIQANVGDSSSGLYQAPTLPGSAVVRVIDQTGATRDESILIQPGAPSQLVLSGASSLTAGDCSAYTVVQKDSYGNLANAKTSATLVNFTGSASSGFYTDSSCTASATTASIPAGSSSTLIYLKDTKAEAFTLAASATGTTSSSLNINIQAGPPSKLALTGPSSVLVNGCSSAYTVKSTDTYGNTSALSSGGTVNLSDGGSAAFYSDSGCATSTTSVPIISGGSTATFYLKDPASESLTLIVSTSGLTNGSLGVLIKSQLVISGAASIEAGTCGTYTVTAEDALGAPFAVPVDTTLTVYNSTPSSRYEAFYIDAACTTKFGSSSDTGYMTLPAGQSSLTLYAVINRASSTQLKIDETSSLSTAGPVFNFTVTPTTASKLVLTGPSFVQPGACSASYTVTSLDTYQNISSVASDTTVSLSSDGTGAGFYLDSGCTISITDITLTSGTNAMQFYFMDSNAELVNLSASVAGFTSGSLLADVSPSTPTIFAATSGVHGCAIINGAVKCWGAGGYLGNNSNSNSFTPVQAIGITSGATSISSSGSDDIHTCAIVNGGALCWGDGYNGELGTGSGAAQLAPVPVVGLSSGVTAIATGGVATCAVVNGAAWCWGNNSAGQLGNNSTTSSNIPVPVQGLTSGVTSIATGSAHSCAVVNSAAKCWGSGSFGSLGDGTGLSSLVPVQVQGLTSGVTAIGVGRNYACAIVNGGVKCWGISTGNTPISVAGLSGSVTQLAVAEFSACAVDAGAAKCWGTGSSPVAATVSGLSSGVSSVSIGARRFNPTLACAATTSGLHCWGLNDIGQMGTGTINDSASVPMSFMSLN